MKTLVCLSALLWAATTPFASAGSATWSIDPTSGDWNTAANWTPATVPDGSSDTATFGVSSITSISTSTNIELSGLIFSSGASAFTLNVANRSIFTLSGMGLLNDSAALQSVDVVEGTLNFTGSATAGTATYAVDAKSRASNGGTIQFFDNSSADHGTFTTEGQLLVGFPGSVIYFDDESTAGEGNFVNGGSNAHEEFGSGGITEFLTHATAGNAHFENSGGNVVGSAGGSMFFDDESSAGAAIIINHGGTISSADGGSVTFASGSTAAQSRITNEPSGPPGLGFPGETFFSGGTAGDATILIKGAQTPSAFAGISFITAGTAGNASFTLTGGKNGGPGGALAFQLKATGGTCRILMFGNSLLYVYGISMPTLTIGSLEGEGSVFLGQKTLQVGANNLDTSFGSHLLNGDPFGGTGPGSLGKVGTGTFSLTDANTYTGGTSVSAGTLRVVNLTGSATGTGPVTVTGGILGGSGIVAGAVTIGTGSGAGAILQPSVGLSQTVTTTVQSLLTFKADGTYTCKLSTQKRKADQVMASGLTIESGAQFNFVVMAKKRIATGTVFTVISNTSATAISGTFANLANGSTLTAGRNKLLVSYFGGDGNDLTLMVQ